MEPWQGTLTQMRGCKGWGPGLGCSPFPTLGMCLSLSFVLPTLPFQRQWWSVKAWELPRNHKTLGLGRSHVYRTVDIDRKKLTKAPVPHSSNGCQGPPSPSGGPATPQGLPSAPPLTKS